MTFDVTITKAAAIARGLNTYGKQTIEIHPSNLTPEQRETLASHYARWSNPVLEVTDLTAGGFAAALDKLRAEAEAEKAREEQRKREEAEKKIKEEQEKAQAEAAFLSNPDARATRYYNGGVYLWQHYYPVGDPICREAERRLALDKAAEAEKERLEKEAIERKAAECRAFLTDLVTEHGTQNQQERMGCDLLPQKEIVDAIRDQVFAPFADLPRYEKITRKECCTCEDYHDCREGKPCKLNCETSSPESVTAEQWDKLREIDQLIESLGLEEKADSRFRLHCCEVSCCDGEVERMGIIVEIKAGPLTLSREFSA